MKTRVIHTKFWTDSYIQTLSIKQKLLFNFLITNERVNMVGAYEMNVTYMQYCTGLSISDISDILEKFNVDKKIFFVDNYVVLLNHLKYQNYSKGSERQKNAFQREKELLPKTIQNIIDDKEDRTSSELVQDQLKTSSELDINHKSKIINNKSEIINKKTKNKKQKTRDKKKITQEDKQEIAKRYQVPLEFVESKFEDLINYIESSGRKYADYHAALRNFVKKDRDKLKMDMAKRSHSGIKVGKVI